MQRLQVLERGRAEKFAGVLNQTREQVCVFGQANAHLVWASVMSGGNWFLYHSFSFFPNVEKFENISKLTT